MTRFLHACQTILRQPGFPGLLAANFALGLAYSFVVPFMSMWGTLHVGMSPFVFGVFMTITTLSAIIMSLVLARWSDTHVARRTMLIIGSLGGVLGYLGYAFIRDVAVLTVIGCLLLALAAVNFSQLFAHLREEFERPENAHVDAPFLMSILRVFFSLAWIAGPALGATVMYHFSYRGIFLAAAGLFAIFLAGVLRYVPHRAHSEERRRSDPPSLLRVLSRPEILFNFSAFVLVFAAHTMSMANLPLMVTQQLGGTEADVGFIFGVAPIVEIPLMIWFGRLAASGHQIPLIRLGMLMSAAYFGAISFVGAPWHIYPIQILTAISIAITTNIAIVYFQDLLPGQAGVATSLHSNSFSLGSLIGYLSFGLLLPSLGHRGIFVFCGGLSALALAILYLAPTTPPPRRVMMAPLPLRPAT